MERNERRFPGVKQVATHVPRVAVNNFGLQIEQSVEGSYCATK